MPGFLHESHTRPPLRQFCTRSLELNILIQTAQIQSNTCILDKCHTQHHHKICHSMFTSSKSNFRSEKFSNWIKFEGSADWTQTNLTKSILESPTLKNTTFLNQKPQTWQKTACLLITILEKALRINSRQQTAIVMFLMKSSKLQPGGNKTQQKAKIFNTCALKAGNSNNLRSHQ